MRLSLVCLVPAILVVHIFSVILTLRVHIVFMMPACILTTLNNSVQQLQFVARVAIWEFCVANALGSEYKLHCFGVHTLASQDV